MSGKDDISKLTYHKERRLQKLKEIKALFGINTRPEYLIEIEDLEADLREQKMTDTLADPSVPGKHQGDSIADLVPQKEVIDYPTESVNTAEIRPGSFSLIIKGKSEHPSKMLKTISVPLLIRSKYDFSIRLRAEDEIFFEL